MAIRRWWHFELPREFYMCYLLSGGPPIAKHRTRWKARKEAVRLSVVHGLPVYVLRTVEVALPAQPAPHPGIDVHSYEVGGVVECWG